MVLIQSNNFTHPARWSLLFCALVLPFLSFSQTPQPWEGSIPIIQSWDKEDLGIEIPQVWEIMEASKGLMYFGTTSGLLEFDGSRWKNITTGGRFSISALCEHPDGRIFFGTQEGRFGFITEDGWGRKTIQFLDDQFFKKPPANKRVKTLQYLDGEILIGIGTKIYIWSESGIRELPLEQEVEADFNFVDHSHGFWFIEKKVGLCRYKNGRIDTVPGNKFIVFPNQTSLFLVSPEKAYLFDSNNNEFEFNPSAPEMGLTPIRLPGEFYTRDLALREFVGIKNPDGTYFFAQSDEGMIQYFPEYGQSVEILPEDGLSSQRINCMFTDSRNAVWVGTMEGISRFAPGKPLQKIRTEDSGGEQVNDLVVHKGQIWALGYGSLFRAEPFERLKKIPTLGGYFSINVFGDDLIFPREGEMFNFSKKKVIGPHGRVYQFPVKYPPDSSLIFWALGHSPIQVFKERQTDFSFLHMLKAQDFNARWLAIDDEGVFWAAHQSMGVRRFHLNESRDSIVKVSFYGPDKGLPETRNYIVYKLHDRDGKSKIVVTTVDGIYRYDPDTDRFQIDEQYAMINHQGFTHPIQELKDGRIVFQQNGVKGLLIPLPQGGYEVEKRPFVEMNGKFCERFVEVDPQNILFCSNEGIYRYDQRKEYDFGRTFPVILRGVQTNDSLVPKKFLDADKKNNQRLKIPFSQNDITFQWAALFYDQSQETRFSYRLSGFKEEWSPWDNEISKEFTNLSGGKYSFQVRAKNIFGTISESVPLEFRIEYPWYLAWYAWVSYGLALILIIYGVVRFRTRQLLRQQKLLEHRIDLRTAEVVAEKLEVERQKERSEQLLRNILPAKVAEELKATGKADAQLIPSATVLFTDFKEFTHIAEDLSAPELVEELNLCFSEFDHIVEKYDVEKIKTIGDAYMAAGGLPIPTENHVINTLYAALDIRDYMLELKDQKQKANLPFFEVRIGINSGPVVAGIVGLKKFQYDIWGDTVNTANRMESSGEVGKVNISQATYDLAKDHPGFRFEYRGKRPVKGKGPMDMYFVERAEK